METGAHILVSGLVQGVGFRYFVDRKARELGLVGIVRNLFSGEVEIDIEGDRSLIEEFITLVNVGPRAAHVSEVRVDWKKPAHQYHDFRIE